VIRVIVDAVRGFGESNCRSEYSSALSAIPEKLEYAWSQRPPITEWVPFKQQLLVTPGNGSISTIEAVCYQFLTNPERLNIISSRRDWLGQRFIELLIEQGYPITVCPFEKHEEKLKWAKSVDPDLAVLYGSDETCKLYEQQLDLRTRVVKYGSKTSIGVHFIYPEQEDYVERFVQEYAKDFFSYDGTGCLNTSVLYIVGSGSGLKSYRYFVEGLVSERDCYIDKRTIPTNRVAQLSAKMVQSGVDFYQNQGVFLRETTDSFDTIGSGNGTAVIVPCRFEDVLNEWESRGRYLSSATLFATSNSFDYVSQRLFNLGVSRIARPGSAQSPTKRWKHDGMSLIPVWGREVGFDL